MSGFNFRTSVHANYPYPDVRIEEENSSYARYILDNVGGHNSEMTTISFYFSSALHVNSELITLLNRINQVEMRHLMIFSSLAQKLGETALLWTNCGRRKVWWSPSFIDYPANLSEILENAYHGEQSTIEKYQWQMDKISDCYVKKILYRIIEDEKIHKNIFKQLIELNKAGTLR